MRVRLTLYHFYLRFVTYSCPFLASFLALVAVRISPGQQMVLNGHEYLYLVILTGLTWVIVAESAGLTNVTQLVDHSSALRTTAVACSVTFATVTVLLFFTRLGNYSRVFLGISALLLLITSLVGQAIFRQMVLQNKSRRRPYRVLVVGTDLFAKRVVLRLGHSSLLSTVVVGHVHVPKQQVSVTGVRILELDELDKYDIDANVDSIIVALPASQHAHLTALMPILERLSVPVRIAVDLGRNVIVREKLFQIGRVQLLDVGLTPAESPHYLLLKRSFDVVFSLAALSALSPLMLLIAAVIRLTSLGPIFFVQERTGLNGKTFSMLKFRTMAVSHSSVSNTVWTTMNDPRRTAFGSFLRRTSLDELPQFINVLRGEMSVVGPRPERPYFVQQFRREFTHYNSRHRLKAGITGWAQVNGLRGDTSIRERVEYDLFYLANWTFLFDLKIIFKTVTSGLVNRNAY